MRLRKRAQEKTTLYLQVKINAANTRLLVYATGEAHENGNKVVPSADRGFFTIEQCKQPISK